MGEDYEPWEDAFCSECGSLMANDFDGGALCPVHDEHKVCEDFPCSGDHEQACVLNKEMANG